AVFAPPNGFVMGDLFAAPDAFQNPRLLIRAIRRYHNHDLLTDDLFSPIAEQPLPAFVPTQDDVVQIISIIGVVRRFDDGHKLAHSDFRLLTFGDVRAATDHSRRVA